MRSQPKFLAIGGAPGCGKTTFRQKLIESGRIDSSYYIYSDDDTLYKMPGYAQAAAKDFYTAREDFIKEVWKITDPALDAAMEARRNILYDRTCSRDVNFEVMQKAKHLGYQVELHALTLDFLSAHYRIAAREKSWARGEREGAHGVRPQAQEKTQAAFSKIFFDYACGTPTAMPLDRVTLWHSGTGKGMIAEYEQGQLAQVRDAREFEKFKATAGWRNDNADARRALMSMYAR